jgi:hypothetical protein
MVFCFVQKIYLVFCPEFNIRLYDKNSESDYVFFPPPKSEYFFQQHRESEYCFKKVKWSVPNKVRSYLRQFGGSIWFSYTSTTDHHDQPD